ncbi:MAG TPA: hypothetical protein VHC22_04090 [Pirellulales bacterium]|nr:hypothetical protein [Pirellulales bacterium]
MTRVQTSYLETLVTETGRGWNRFWFMPSDPMPLGVMRVAIGAIAVYLIASLTPDLNRYFGPQGLLPVQALRDLVEPTNNDLQTVPPQVREAMPREFRFSYLDRIQDGKALTAVHFLGLGVLVLFTLGFYTRITAVGALVVFLSYLHRGPMLTSGTEPIVAMLIFYLCIGPSGNACSLDAWLAAKRQSLHEGEPDAVVTSPWATLAVRLIQVHLTLIYAMMAVGKVGNEVWWSGLGIWWLIARAESRLVDLTGLHRVPLLINAWTYAVLFWQSLMPILIWNRLARPLMLVLNAVMWILLAPIVGNLPLAAVMIVGSLAFVSPEILRRWVPRPAHRAELAAQVAA